MRSLFILIACFCLFFLNFGEADAETYKMQDYYPLGQNDYWIYARELYITEPESGTEDRIVMEETVKVIGTKMVKDVECVELEINEGEFYRYDYVTMTEEGLRTYKDIAEDGCYKIEDSPAIEFPAEMEKGQSFYDFHTFTCYEKDGSLDETGQISRTVELTKEDVTVGQKLFNDCLKLSYSGLWEESGGDYGKIKHTLWLAKGLGVIKSIWEEEYINPQPKPRQLIVETLLLKEASIAGRKIEIPSDMPSFGR